MRNLVVALLFAALGGLVSGPALGQSTNQVTLVSPNTAVQGTANILVTFTLDTDVPPAPPAGVLPASVTIGSISGTSVTHSSQYAVTARFDLSSEAVGTKDVNIAFSTPNGTLVFSKMASFTVTSAVNTPPSITKQPASQAAWVGGSVTLTVAASGTTPLSYQWQKNDANISGATTASYTISPVAQSDAGNYRCVVANNYGSATSNEATLTVSSTGNAWRFAVVGDTHVPTASIAGEIASSMLADGVKLALFPGDIVNAGAGVSKATLLSQLDEWKSAMAPLYSAGVGVYPIRGNHEADVPDGISAWNSAFAGSYALPANGPSGETNLTYCVTYNNALIVALDDYVNIHRVNQTWLNQQLASNTRPHVFAFGHESAFKVFHSDCLDDYTTNRNTLWASLTAAGARTYFCGHDHFFDVSRIDDGDGNTNDLYQVIVGTGGGSFFDTYNYNGNNSPYTPVGVDHIKANGYLLVEVSGTGTDDLGVTLTFKQRTVSGSTVTYQPAYTWSYTASGMNVSDVTYPIVDTGQTISYSDSSKITAPAQGQPFYGQDAQFAGNQPSYTLSSDGLTVHDNVTGLTWQRSPDTDGDGMLTYADKLTYSQALARPAAMNTAHYGGYSDWRLPSIKELYSLILFSGIDVASLYDTAGAKPFIDTNYFGFAYGFTRSGERVIDSQWATATLYVANAEQMFGVNFADGRIKGYPDTDAVGKKFCVICVRGNGAYGVNKLVDNGDLTVTDHATGLMWSKNDSGSGMNWGDALAWVQTKNSQNYLGHNDWRMPNAKELQSILDYTRSPDTTSSAAISPLFNCTKITSEKGVADDYPWYWSSSTHVTAKPDYGAADYFCFGRAWGYMGSSWQDVHGAGAQRGDPKSGSLSSYTYAPYGYYNPVAPQGDAVRISNYIRLVRDFTPTALSSANAAKALTDGTDVSLASAVVTGTESEFGSMLYVEDADRTSGIRVAPINTVSGLARGSKVRVTGRLSTTAAGERQITNAVVTPCGYNGELTPIGMNSLSAAGGVSGSQCGTSGGLGLNNVGLLVRVWGNVTSTGSGYLDISDGGTAIRIDTSKLMTTYNTGEYIGVTGISSLYLSGSDHKSLVIPRDDSDIKKI